MSATSVQSYRRHVCKEHSIHIYIYLISFRDEAYRGEGGHPSKDGDAVLAQHVQCLSFPFYGMPDGIVELSPSAYRVTCEGNAKNPSTTSCDAIVPMVCSAIKAIACMSFSYCCCF